MTRREEAEKIWRQKFEAFGFNECFEFLYRDWNTHKGRKCVMRCRECGVEFESWAFAECVKGRQAHILCPNCGASSDGDDKWTRSSQCDAAMEYYTQGHSVRETAEKFGVSISQINNVVKHRKLTNGKNWKEEGQKSNEKRMKDADVDIPKRKCRTYIQRAKRFHVPYECGITLHSVLKRKGLRCAICGNMCDLNDREWGDFGPTYPSIDHIIPLAKGGSHTWDNIQVAHMICNSQKGDKLEAIS